MVSTSTQVVILAGGLATRLRSVTTRLPKSMIAICGKPFLQHQIELLHSHGIDDIVLCVGYLGEQIASYFGDGSRFGVRLSYSWDGQKLRGTGGALKNAAPLLSEDFLILYGDSYLLLDYQDILSFFRRTDKLGLMVVYRNCNEYDRSNLAVENGLVTVYDKSGRTSSLSYIDEGLSVLRRGTLALFHQQDPADLGQLFQALITRGELLAWETQQRFYEVGSEEGLEEFRRLWESKQGAN